MAVSKKPRKRKIQKRGKISKTLKDFKKMNSKEQFLSLHQDLDKVMVDLFELLDLINQTKEPLVEQHKTIVENIKEKLTSARSFSLEIFDKHVKIQERKNNEKDFTVADENMEYCLIGSDVFEQTNILMTCFEELQTVVSALK